MFYYPIQDPCILDLDTEAGFVTLMIDRKNPVYVFMSLNHELVKCFDLTEHAPLRLATDHAAKKFLRQFAHSEFFQHILREEIEFEEKWREL